jgi:CheY-like chemotaxis protein
MRSRHHFKLVREDSASSGCEGNYPARPRLRALVIGDIPGELAAASDETWGERAIEWRLAADRQEAMTLLERGDVFERIVLCERRPGQWDEAAVHALRAAAPLANFVRLSGSWCEGQARSGRPPSGCPSIGWQNWPTQGPAAWSKSSDQATTIVPATATPEERLLASVRPETQRQLHGKVVICSRSASAASALADACQSAGLQTRVLASGENDVTLEARALIWDTEPRLLHDATGISKLKTKVTGARLIALVGFPRAEDVVAARRAGVDAVLSKPFWVGDLLTSIASADGGRLN